MYDISGVPSDEVEEAIKADYLHLVREPVDLERHLGAN
jgi:hypothetical protein